ncbi:hypothetical protein HOLleu_24869 [Holothuria leucospilota]|uniref:Uncharacterized protein n=1 Tax=Holothuria leucospilota TaxID=206669 RepID=A0A9Q1H3Y9_HOLLE|nr:hypothetical protein HOLleu_24869 [Holothuria leucospilota]
MATRQLKGGSPTQWGIKSTKGRPEPATNLVGMPCQNQKTLCIDVIRHLGGRTVKHTACTA